MAHWYDVFNGHSRHLRVVRGPEEVIDDPQLRANDIVVPLEGAATDIDYQQPHPGARLPSTSQARPGNREHNEEILEQLGFMLRKSKPSAPAASFRRSSIWKSQRREVDHERHPYG